tara:strand:- start:618 stop:1379 length:762 start_codon:yes stop_codon:yes gene_type:complete
MVKVILNKLLAYFNLKLVNKKFVGTIDKRELTPYSEDNHDYKLYFQGLIKSKNTNTDNFFKQSRHLDLISLSKKVLGKEKVYDFVECGCWKGHSSFFISKLIDRSEKKINFHIFDSFEGLSKDTKKDDGLLGLNDREINKIRKQFISNEDFVKNTVLKEFGFVKIYKGWIPEKFELITNLKFSLIHIDVDLYEPTLKSLEFFYPRLEDGGVIVCDDYNSKMFNGSKRAWDEFFKKNKSQFNFSPSLSSSFAIK